MINTTDVQFSAYPLFDVARQQDAESTCSVGSRLTTAYAVQQKCANAIQEFCKFVETCGKL